MKKLHKIVLIVLSFCIATSIFGQSSTHSLSTEYEQFHEKTDSLLDFAHRYIGKPYRYASKGPNSFDCSGFTSFVFSNFGYKLGASSRDQFTKGLKIPIAHLKKGDLVFFGGRSNRSVGHVGIVVFADTLTQSFKFIHAATSGGIRVDEYPKEPYYANRYRGARRMLYDTIAPFFSSEIAGFSEIAEPSDFAEQTGFSPSTNIELSQDTSLIQTPTKHSLYYKVKSGDTLYRIAKNNGCSVDELKKWNKLSSNKIAVGKKLKIKP